jgi:hypothetical protein
MSIVIIKDITGALIPFDQLETGILAAFIAFTTVTTLLDMVLIYAIVKQRAIPIDSQFILHICVCDILFSLVLLAFHCFNLYSGGWATGKLGCEINATAILLTIGSSVLTLLFMTIHRYLIFIWRYHLSQNQIYQTIAGIWIFFGMVASLYLSSRYVEEGVALQSSKYYCMIDFTTNEPRSLLIVYLVLSVVGITMFFITYAYSAIVSTYMRLKRRAAQMMMGPTTVAQVSKSKRDQEMSSQEKLLITKAIAISGAYIICWVPCMLLTIVVTPSRPSEDDCRDDYKAASFICI